MNRIHCHKCGRFVGPDGFIDITYDDYNGGYEEGYSECARCRDERFAKEEQVDKLPLTRAGDVISDSNG